MRRRSVAIAANARPLYASLKLSGLKEAAQRC